MARVLVADDEPLQRLLICEILSTDPGLTLIEAENSQQVLFLACHQPPDVILIGCRLPYGNIRQTCRLLKTDPASCFTPLIIISTQPDMQEWHAMDCDDYLVKPFEPAELEAKVHHHLSPKTIQMYQQRNG